MINFSIISVCYNCENEIDKTINSLLKQDYKDYEYIIVDGKSTDATLNKIVSYKDRFDKIRIISEPDKGIYDAMNKGIEAANGEYIYFLNMGDCFFSQDVLSYVASKLCTRKDFYYGNIQRGDKVIYHKKNIRKRDLIFREYMICHQSIFAKRESLERFSFDNTYKICADREWLITLLEHGGQGEYLDKIVALYDESGISGNLEKFTKDSLRIAKAHGGKKAIIIIKLKRFVGKVLKKVRGFF